MSACDVLRTLWAEEVKVTTRPDGSLALKPSERVTSDILQLARDAKPEIAELVSTLPAAGRCPLCGESTGWSDRDQLHCVSCAQIAANLVLQSAPESEAA